MSQTGRFWMAGGRALSLMLAPPPSSPGEDQRIKEFYQSRGLERVVQPSGDGELSMSCVVVLNGRV